MRFSMSKHRAFSYLSTAALTTAATLVAATPAHAADIHGCVYPRVCFYLSINDYNANRVAAAYRDFGQQTLGPSAHASRYVVNTRNDDGALIIEDGGTRYCFTPHAVGPVTFPKTINIMDNRTC